MGKAQQQGKETRLLAQAAFNLARSLNISTVLVQADELRDVHLVERLRESERIMWVTRDSDSIPGLDRRGDIVIQIPDAALTRMSQLNLALFLSALNQKVELDETTLCLTGAAGTGRLDLLFITSPERVLPRFRKHEIQFVASRDLARIVEIVLRFAAEGREGTPIGTIFVLGSMEELAPHVRQLVLNPCAGHSKTARNIHNPELLETLREFAAMDGAFVVNLGGVVESAGTYLDASIDKSILRSGLGARHAAAQAITTVTTATAVVLSSSSGTVTVFHGGEAILELEKPLTAVGPQERNKGRPVGR